VIVVVAFDASVHDALHEPQESSAFAAFLAGYEALRASTIELAARVLVDERSIEVLAATLARLRTDGVKIDEVCVTDPSLEAAVRAEGFEPVPARP
jgi:hypothetical protein